MTPPTDKPENPWKKRRKGPREFMPPSRALFAEKDGNKACATWLCVDGLWHCQYAGNLLRWMRGSNKPQIMESSLMARGFTWHWIEPNTVRVVEPPF